MSEIIAVIVCISFFLWIVWKLIISELFYSRTVLKSVMICEIVVNILLVILSIRRWNVIWLLGVVIFALVDYIVNSGIFEFKEVVLEWLGERRNKIEMWEDMVIDLNYIFIVIQISIILTS